VLIRIEGLVHRYSAGTPLERTALRGVSLEIGAGERVAILGPTGSGKSTLAQHLAGLLRPTAGRVLLDGVAAHERSAAAQAQRQRVGLAFQYPEAQFFAQTVYREVAFGPRNLGLEKAEIAARARWALEMVGLNPSEIESRVPFTLSGGEMRRVALASILSLRPDALILDEPTAGLDPQGRRELLTRVQAWQKSIGPTLVVISHDLGDLARIAERVVLLKEGRVMADGPTRQVLSDEELLRAAGLEAPQPTALLHLLKRMGWPVRTDRLLPEEAAAEIARVHRRSEVMV